MNPYPKPEKKQKEVIPAATYREKYLSKTRKKKKYRNKSQVYTTTLYGSRTFDSIKEANYCEELDYRLMAGEIKHYELQPKIDIRVNGKHICNYFCDFKVVNNDGSIEYHEVKSSATMTQLWHLKWNLVLALKDELLELGAQLIVIK